MEINLLENEAIDKKAWDDCLFGSPGFELYMQSSYLDIVFPKWKALVVGRYYAAFPIFEKKIIVWKSLKQPLFTGPWTVIGSDLGAVKILTSYLPDFLKNYDHGDLLLFKDLVGLDPSIQKTTRKFQQLKIAPEGFIADKSLRKNLNKATRAGIENISPISSDKFIKDLKEHVLSLHKIINKEGLDLLKKILTHKDLFGGECIGIRNNGDTIFAGQFLLSGKNKIYFILSYNTPEGKKNSALHSLHLKIINKHLFPYGTLHFGGSNIERIAEYNYNYGSTDVSYLVLKLKNNLLNIVDKFI